MNFLEAVKTGKWVQRESWEGVAVKWTNEGWTLWFGSGGGRTGPLESDDTGRLARSRGSVLGIDSVLAEDWLVCAAAEGLVRLYGTLLGRYLAAGDVVQVGDMYLGPTSGNWFAVSAGHHSVGLVLTEDAAARKRIARPV